MSLEGPIYSNIKSFIIRDFNVLKYVYTKYIISENLIISFYEMLSLTCCVIIFLFLFELNEISSKNILIVAVAFS